MSSTDVGAWTAVFQPGESVSAGRIRLSHLHADVLAGMTPWLAASLAPEWTLADVEGPVAAGAAALITEASSGAPIGVAVAQVGLPALEAASLPFIAVDPERRYRGLGGEAALALERHLRRSFAVREVYAPVPDGRGLAVYFWLRLGYRPLLSSEAPGPVVGLRSEQMRGIWLHRAAD